MTGLQGNMQGQQTVRIKFDLILSNKTADGRDLCDPRHSFKRDSAPASPEDFSDPQG